jgi:S-DNA-T family DNA segregation ATPase FtsK/SpoIIIE
VTTTEDPSGKELEVRPSAEVSEVVDAELVEQLPLGRPEPPTLIGTIVEHPVQTVVHAVIVIRESPKVRRAVTPVRVGARATYTTGQGFAWWWRRAVDAATHGKLRRAEEAAEAANDAEALLKARAALETARNNRQARIMRLPLILGACAAVTLGIVLLIGIVLLVGGILVWAFDGNCTPTSPPDCGGITWTSWWDGVADFWDAVGTWGRRIITWALWAAGPVIVWAAWREGRRRGSAPRWLVTDDERAEMDSVLTADMIVRALMHAKVPALTKFLENGGLLEFLVNPREQGGGTYFRVRLCFGVMAADLLSAAKVELVAGNMGRHKHEYWPQKDPETDARTLDCWVADKGTLDRPAPPWPLLESGEFDVFRDRLPWGVTMRSEQISVGMLQKHWLVGATSKQGKTTAIRVLMLGLALDPTVELRIADLKGDGDWSMFAERAHTLIEGQTDEDAEATCSMLESAVAEMQRRYDRKRALGIIGPISRELSRQKGSGFHPIWVVVDECQILYAAPHPVGGTKDDARAWRAAKRLHDQARAVNVHLVQATQRPDNRTLPVQVREGAHVRAALNVPNEEAAKMILADAADRGARPQDLRAGADAGTVVATGEIEDIPSGQAFAIVRTHYVTTKESYVVITRAMQIMKRAGRTVSGPAEISSEPEPIDHLADIHEAMRDEIRVRTQVVIQRLSEYDPDTYEQWTFPDLKAELGQHGIQAVKVKGVMHVRLGDVQKALQDRDEQTPPDEFAQVNGGSHLGEAWEEDSPEDPDPA